MAGGGLIGRPTSPLGNREMEEGETHLKVSFNIVENHRQIHSSSSENSLPKNIEEYIYCEFLLESQVNP